MLDLTSYLRKEKKEVLVKLVGDELQRMFIDGLFKTEIQAKFVYLYFLPKLAAWGFGVLG